MSRKKISTTVYITPEQNERLHQLSNRTKVPTAVYIREGIDLVLERYKHALPGQMTLADANKKTAKKKDDAGIPAPGVLPLPDESS
jgi:predicted DNA-binding protein